MYKMDEEIKISEMLEAENINEEDFIQIIQNGINKKISASKVGNGEKITVIDNLLSTSTTDALSANMGRKLRTMIEEVDNTTRYNTTETKIGTWIDGKPIYRKVIFINKTNSTNIGNLNFDFITIKNFALSSGMFIFSNNRYNSDNDLVEVFLNKNQKTIEINTGSAWTNYTAYVTLEYTKTTD